jgi:hypothetical protein
MNAFIPAPVFESLLAQTSGPSLNISWAIVIFGILIGLALTLSPSRRTYEVKRPKDE